MILKIFDLGNKKLWQKKRIFWSFFDLEKNFKQVNPPNLAKILSGVLSEIFLYN